MKRTFRSPLKTIDIDIFSLRNVRETIVSHCSKYKNTSKLIFIFTSYFYIFQIKSTETKFKLVQIQNRQNTHNEFVNFQTINLLRTT